LEASCYYEHRFSLTIQSAPQTLKHDLFANIVVFLWSGFRSNLWFWFVIPFIYKIALSAFATLIDIGSSQQFILILSLLVIFNLAHVLMNPFENWRDNWLFAILSIDAVACFGLAISLFVLFFSRFFCCFLSLHQGDIVAVKLAQRKK
jgi:hypothetical protein